MEHLRAFHDRSRRAAGRPESLAREAAARGGRWLKGAAQSRQIFGAGQQNAPGTA